MPRLLALKRRRMLALGASSIFLINVRLVVQAFPPRIFTILLFYSDTLIFSHLQSGIRAVSKPINGKPIAQRYIYIYVYRTYVRLLCKASRLFFPLVLGFLLSFLQIILLYHILTFFCFFFSFLIPACSSFICTRLIHIFFTPPLLNLTHIELLALLRNMNAPINDQQLQALSKATAAAVRACPDIASANMARYWDPVRKYSLICCIWRCVLYLTVYLFMD